MCIRDRKVPALNVAKAAPEVGAEAWMLPYSAQKSIACVSGKVKDVSKVAGEYHYYKMCIRDRVDIDMSKRKFVDVQVIFHKMEQRTLSAAYKFYCEKNLEDAHLSLIHI